jgi:hypothetical protein
LKNILTFILLFLLSLTRLLAQSNTGALGGEATGTGGKASFTAGEVFYTYKSGASGSVTDGVQQAVAAAPCVNPTAGGTIATATASVLANASFDLTSTAAASGQSGTLEYKWQRSTKSATTGFTDIANSNSATFTTTISATTWFKRLARVSCTSDWRKAAESNVVQVTVASASDCSPILDNAYESNDSQGSAWSINLDPTYTANLKSNLDQDWYRLSNLAAGVYTIFFNPTGATESQLVNVSPANGVVTINGASKAQIIVVTLKAAGSLTIKIVDPKIKTRQCYTFRVVAGNLSGTQTSPEARESFELEPALQNMQLELVASPNPVKDQLQVVITEAGSQPSVRVQLLSTDQRVQGSYQVPVVEGRAEQTIDVRLLPEGTYLLTVDGQHGRVSRKVLKMN